MRVLIAGDAGLVGPECRKLFAKRSWNVEIGA